MTWKGKCLEHVHFLSYHGLDVHQLVQLDKSDYDLLIEAEVDDTAFIFESVTRIHRSITITRTVHIFNS